MKSHLGRRSFSSMELYTLFKGYIYSDFKVPREQPKHWHFWLPILAYYTGGFSDEIAQLSPEKIVRFDQVRGFLFTSNEKIKSRFIPIHEALYQHGWLDYLAFIEEQKATRLLFDLPSKNGRYSEKARIWFSGEGKRAGYLQKCQIPNIDLDGRKASLSSFRLNFEEQIRIHAIQAGSKDAFNYLMGFKDYSLEEFADMRLLQRIVRGIRPLPNNITWQRFCERH